jgi:hypothetical protein
MRSSQHPRCLALVVLLAGAALACPPQAEGHRERPAQGSPAATPRTDEGGVGQAGGVAQPPHGTATGAAGQPGGAASGGTGPASGGVTTGGAAGPSTGTGTQGAGAEPRSGGGAGETGGARGTGR